MSGGCWTIRSLLKVTTAYLKEKEIDSPRLSAEVLLAHLLDIDRIKLYLDPDRPLTEAELTGYRNLIRRRVTREPLQYITGKQEFWSLEFWVGPGVLIPRPESELLVETLLYLFKNGKVPGTPNPHILDLCTGSGALCIALAREIQGASFRAVDNSPLALETARKNAVRHGVDSRIEFCLGDLFEPLEAGARFDAVISNPPYVASEEMDRLPEEVRDYEPRGALDGGEGGMQFIRRIIVQASRFLNDGGWLLLETAPDQTGPAVDLLHARGSYEEIERKRDFAHRYRVVLARKTA